MVIGKAKPQRVLESLSLPEESEEDRKGTRKGDQNLFDSGAFTMHTKKIKVDLEEYAQFIIRHRDIIEVAANLDAIGGIMPRTPMPIKRSWKAS